MDRITSSFVEEFCSRFSIEGDESTRFEHFCNYSVLEKYSNGSIPLEEVHIGVNSNQGIDGFAIFVNGVFIEDEDTLSEIFDTQRDLLANIVFIQAKRSASIDWADIGSFGWCVKDFLSESPQINWNTFTRSKIGLFNSMIRYTSKLKEKPKLDMYFITLATINDSQDRRARIDGATNDIRSLNLFKDVKIDVLGSEAIQKCYKDIGKTFEKTFEFPQRVTLPIIEGVKEAYLGYISARQVLDIITDENGNIVSELFYDNIRDYQGDNSVNKEIDQTIKSHDAESFIVLNNGISIIAESLTTSRNSFTIGGFQIVNGCQTSHVIYNNRESLPESITVPIKVIVTENEDVTSRIIRATNNQTPVEVQDLIAFSDFQKRLEHYFNTFEAQHRFYYERRSKQYNRSNISYDKIIDKTTMIKAVSSYFLDQPHKATRYFGAMFKDFGDKLFRQEHKFSPYYIAAISLVKIDEAIKNHVVDAKYKRARFHLLMAIKYEIGNCPRNLSDRKIDEYSENVKAILFNDVRFREVIENIQKVFANFTGDWASRDISKSVDLTDHIRRYYNYGQPAN
jgi:hypothetical protein